TAALFVPSERDRKWLELYDRHKGKIDADFGRLAFTTPPLAAFASVDAKYTTSDLAKDLKTWAVFGPPLGRTWEPSFRDRTRYPEVRPLVGNPWTVLHPTAPDATRLARAPVDLHDPAESELEEKEEAWREPHTEPAWHGTILPKTGADLWLA